MTKASEIQNRLDLFQYNKPVLPVRNEPSRRRTEGPCCAFDLRNERRNGGLARRLLGPRKRSARHRRVQPSN